MDGILTMSTESYASDLHCIILMQNSGGGYGTYELTRSYSWIEVYHYYFRGYYALQTVYFTTVRELKTSFWVKNRKKIHQNQLVFMLDS